VFDAAGRLVRTLVDTSEGAGAHDVTFDGRDDNGRPVASGVYFYRLDAGTTTQTRKMVLLK
jgi:flagellar hook assembly protein FlgD